MKVYTNCKSCDRHLGEMLVYGDVFCPNCKTYNVIRPNKEVKLIYKDFYNKNKMESVPSLLD